jgi:hypothetical protein
MTIGLRSAHIDVIHEFGHIIDWHSSIGNKSFSAAWEGSPMTEYARSSDWERWAEAVSVYVLGPTYFLRSPQTGPQIGMDISGQMDRMKQLLEGWR